MQRQFAALGVAVEIDEDGTDDVAVWSINWGALDAFLLCETQWRVLAGAAGMIWLGLDYTAVDVALRRADIEVNWRDLQVMEAAALDVFAEARP